ncbi:hypothetical protein [Rhodovulum sp. P5]|uniref:hypothetical protein n=1 Tax=Rhodovulum sp. P5 TaxID=1564506 RepID=UPI0009DB2047|nr:hypothetical protein [Rhodovulum sp. P5]
MTELADRPAGRVVPPLSIACVIEQHGAWRVLGAALVALFDGRGRPGNARLGQLDNHLREDIGLPPLPPTRPPDRTQWW